MRHDAAARLRLGQREYGVGGAARLESAALLEVLAREVQLRTDLRIERRAREHRGDADLAGDALARLLDEIPAETWGVAGHGRISMARLAGGSSRPGPTRKRRALAVRFSARRAPQPRRGVGAHRAAPARRGRPPDPPPRR